MQRYNKYFIFANGEGYFQKKVVPLHANLNNYV